METQTGSRMHGLQALVIALLDSGLPEVHGFVEELAVEIRTASGRLDFDPRLTAIFPENPEQIAAGGRRPERDSS